MISFKDYYIQQIKDLPMIWRIAKKYKAYKAFFGAVILLFCPLAIKIMWLYDTEQMERDRRFSREE